MTTEPAPPPVLPEPAAAISPAQLAALRSNGLNDLQISSALGIAIEQIQQADARSAVATGNLDTLFNPAQIEMAKRIVMQQLALAETDSGRLKAAELIFKYSAIPYETRFKAAAGMDKASVVNNIMVAVSSARDKASRHHSQDA